jgi:hypothetical protein
MHMEHVFTLKINLYFDIRPQVKKKALFILVSWDVTILFTRMKLTKTPFKIC